MDFKTHHGLSLLRIDLAFPGSFSRSYSGPRYLYSELALACTSSALPPAHAHKCSRVQRKNAKASLLRLFDFSLPWSCLRASAKSGVLRVVTPLTGEFLQVMHRSSKKEEPLWACQGVLLAPGICSRSYMAK